MLPGLINKADRKDKHLQLVLLGIAASITGFTLSVWIFKGYAELLTPIIIAIPMIPAFRRRIIGHEKDQEYFNDELKAYGSLFIGEMMTFIALVQIFPQRFNLQQQITGITGKAVMPNNTLTQVFTHNIEVYAIIFILSAIAGSVGAIVISWNASIIGIVFGEILQNNVLKVATYIPHTSLEMGGYIVAAVAGTLSSKAARRDIEHLETQNIMKYAALGAALIVLGAVVENI